MGDWADTFLRGGSRRSLAMDRAG